MFDISFGELLLVFVLGLIVLGPQRLPVAVKTVVGWIRALRSLASSVQSELAHELKLQELQDSLKKVEKASVNNLTPELKASMDALREATESMKRPFTTATSSADPEKESDEAHTIHPPAAGEKPVGTDNRTATEHQTPVAPVESDPSVAPASAAVVKETTGDIHYSDSEAAGKSVKRSEPASSSSEKS